MHPLLVPCKEFWSYIGPKLIRNMKCPRLFPLPHASYAANPEAPCDFYNSISSPVESKSIQLKGPPQKDPPRAHLPALQSAYLPLLIAPRGCISPPPADP